MQYSLRRSWAPDSVEHLVPDHDLDDAGGVPEIDERHPAVIASAADPAGQRHFCSGVLGPEGAGTVGAHHKNCPLHLMGAGSSRRRDNPSILWATGRVARPDIAS